MEHHHAMNGQKPTISMAMFNNYVSHYQRVFPPLNHIKPPFSYAFPVVFLRNPGLTIILCQFSFWKTEALAM